MSTFKLRIKQLAQEYLDQNNCNCYTCVFIASGLPNQTYDQIYKHIFTLWLQFAQDTNLVIDKTFTTDFINYYTQGLALYDHQRDLLTYKLRKLFMEWVVDQ